MATTLEGLKPPPSGGDALAGGVEGPDVAVDAPWDARPEPRLGCRASGRHGHGVPGVAKPRRIRAAAAAAPAL